MEKTVALNRSTPKENALKLGIKTDGKYRQITFLLYLQEKLKSHQKENQLKQTHPWQ